MVAVLNAVRKVFWGTFFRHYNTTPVLVIDKKIAEGLLNISENRALSQSQFHQMFCSSICEGGSANKIFVNDHLQHHL